MEIFELFSLVAIGLSAGFVGGMLGVGGSIVMIPALTELYGPNQHLYQAAAMIVNFFVVVPAVYQHRRAGAIDRSTVIRLIPAALFGVVVGVGVSELPVFAADGEAYLRGLFGLFLLYIVVRDLRRRFRRGNGVPEAETPATASDGTHGPSTRWRTIASVGLPTGFIAGLLGIGGGVMAVPLQRRLLNMPMRQAIANSATIIVATSLVGAGMKNYAYVTDHEYSIRSFILAGVLIPTAIIGSLVGSRLTHRAPLSVIKLAFFSLILVAAGRMLYQAALSLS